MRELELQYKPLPIFKPFHESQARVRCLIGGLGSGKSTALCWEIIRLCMNQPGLDAMLLRRFVPALRDSTEAAFFETLPNELAAACVIRRQGGHVESIRFPNDSLLKFRGAEDWETKHKGQELGLVAFDEVDEVPEATAIGLLSRLRQSSPLAGHKLPPGRKMPNHMLLASNPRGQNWVWAAFVQENSPTHWPNSSVHLSTALDNPYLPPEYIDMLMSRPANYVRRFVYCHFDRSNGAAYPEWGWDTHVLAAQPPGYYGDRIWMAMDPGILDPTAGLWCEVDRHRGRLVAVAEYEETGRSAPDHASAWRQLERKFAPVKVVRRVADPSISKRDPGTSMELADIYQRLGFTFERGPVRAEIRTPALANIIATGQFVGTEACPRLHDQIMRSSWEDQMPRLRDLGEFREKLKKGNDHIHDCAQYLATLHIAPLKNVKPENAPPPKTNDEIVALWEKERMAKMAAKARAGLNPKITPREGEIW